MKFLEAVKTGAESLNYLGDFTLAATILWASASLPPRTENIEQQQISTSPTDSSNIQPSNSMPAIPQLDSQDSWQNQMRERSFKPRYY